MSGRRPPRLPHEGVAAGRTILIGEPGHYLVRVLRLRPGERVVLFDPECRLEADAVIVADDAPGVVLDVGAPRAAVAPSRREITLVQGAAKGEKVEAVVRDATELGVARVVVAITERSVAKPPPGRAERWRRIALDAARQCGRCDVPRIDGPLPFDEALARFGSPPGACFDPCATATLGQLVRAADRAPLVLLVGPEGGLTATEIAGAAGAGLTPVTLGPLTLRTETVAAAALGAVRALDDG